MSLTKQSLSGAAGEHLVLGELLRKKHEAYLAHGKTQEGWDIVVLRENGNNVRVQVKSIDWPNELAVNGKFEDGFDVLVVVLLNCDNLPRFLIIPQNQLEPLISAVNSARDGNQRTLTVGKNFATHTTKNLIQYENMWQYITGNET